MFVDIICVRDKKKKIQTKKNYLHGKQQVLHSIMLTLPGGGLWISSDRDDWRIFGGLKFSIVGFFWVAKFGKYFSVWPDLSWDFFGYSEHDSASVS